MTISKVINWSKLKLLTGPQVGGPKKKANLDQLITLKFALAFSFIFKFVLKLLFL